MEGGYMENRNIKIIKTATEALEVLWQEGFFKVWQNNPKIVSNLAKRGNNFSPAELGMALKRAKHVTRRGSRGKYEYIQKHPYTKEELKTKPKRKK